MTGTQWQTAPARHEAGSPNVVGAAALAAACDALAALDPADLHAHEAALRTALVAGLEAVPGVRVVRVWDDAVDPVGVVTFAVEGHDPGLVAAYLSAEHGIGVRDGRFCAHPLLARLGYDAGAIRASVGVGTTGADVVRLVEAVRAYVEQGPTTRYEVVDGCWAVVDDPARSPRGPAWRVSSRPPRRASSPTPRAADRPSDRRRRPTGSPFTGPSPSVVHRVAGPSWRGVPRVL